ncbi:MAG: enamine deaminase RidA [Rhodospirillaceae bacterium]|nr:enamine deaminase RidA [Rhodospirillaceae bacterium]|tara:strand:- start:38 stop:514 length:477 start_codon:yes stop_codon:yes gene_type:complete
MTKLKIISLLFTLPVTTPIWSQGLVPVTKDYLIDEYGESRAFSRAVATTGGTTVWVAGHTTLTDERGNDISGDFEAQTREVFRLIGERLNHYGGTLSDIVTMTVYIQDVRDGDRFTEIRSEYFSDGRYPSSALITVVGFARPGTMIEIKPTAVIGQER